MQEPATSPTAYDPFALAYNALWGPIALSWLQWLSVLVIPRLAPHATVIDFCCGTGQVAGQLAQRGFRMMGLDGSRAMLLHARRNAPTIPLVQADIRRFSMRQRCDAALCLFDSLNHLLTVNDLRAAFGSVSECVRPGGWFFFDVNTLLSYESHWRGRRRLRADGCGVSTESVYDSARRLGVFRAVVRSDSGATSAAAEVTLWQRYHDHAEILCALKEAGFRAIETYGLERDALVKGSLEGTERTFYLARRGRASHQP